MLTCLQDLFTLTYPSYQAAVPGWQAGPPHGMHYGMQQYNNPMVQFFYLIYESIMNMTI